MKISRSLPAILAAIVSSLHLMAQEKAVVNLGSIYLYSNPSYTSSLETQELMGEEAEILERSGYWVKIRIGQPYEAWTTEKCLVRMDGKSLEEYRKCPKYICTAMNASLLGEASEDSRKLGRLVWGALIRINSSGVDGKPLKQNGYCSVTLPDGRKGWVEESSVTPYKQWDASRNAMTPQQKASAVTAFARQLEGVPYLWGGMTVNGMDCSGLTRLCYLAAGIKLPRNASEQAQCGTQIDPKKDFSALREGDLIFFGRNGAITHVGIYLAEGRFIHCSQYVRINSLLPGAPDRYVNAANFVRAVRIINCTIQE